MHSSGLSGSVSNPDTEDREGKNYGTVTRSSLAFKHSSSIQYMRRSFNMHKDISVIFRVCSVVVLNKESFTSGKMNGLQQL